MKLVSSLNLFISMKVSPTMYLIKLNIFLDIKTNLKIWKKKQVDHLLASTYVCSSKLRLTRTFQEF